MPDEVKVTEVSGCVNLFKNAVPNNIHLTYFNEFGEYRGILLNSEGFVDISIPVNTLFTKNELIDFCLKFADQFVANADNVYKQYDMMNWINENLK